MLPKEQKVSYDKFYHSARRNKILPSNVTVLVHLASAMALGCYP